MFLHISACQGMPINIHRR